MAPLSVFEVGRGGRMVPGRLRIPASCGLTCGLPRQRVGPGTVRGSHPKPSPGSPGLEEKSAVMSSEPGHGLTCSQVRGVKPRTTGTLPHISPHCPYRPSVLILTPSDPQS